MMHSLHVLTLDDENLTAQAFGRVVDVITRQFMEAVGEVPITFELEFVMEDDENLVKGRISSNNHAVRIRAQLFLDDVDKDAH